MNRSQARRLALGGVGGIILFLLPIFLPEIRIHIFTEVLIYALFAIGFNLLFGYTGLLPFGAAALFGVGAYATALLLNHLPGTPLLLALLMAAFSGLVAAAVIGFFCVRLSGPYFALSTLAFQMFLFAVAWKWRSVTRGDDGIGLVRPDLHLPALGSISMKSIDNMYYLTLIVAGLAIAGCYFFLKTPLGNSAVCVREKEVRASFLGINVFLIKLIVFSAAGVLIGLAGGLFVLYQGFVATACMDLNMGMTPVLMTIIGGSGHFFGPVVGAAFYVIFQDWISSMTSYWMIIMGSIFVIVVLYVKGGLISLFQIDKVWRRRESK
jgi:branched-chain amino acid transport system permease protein